VSEEKLNETTVSQTDAEQHRTEKGRTLLDPIQCPPPPLDMSVTVKGITFGNFNSNFLSFAMTSETAWIGL
jgi:hypothetical protein